MIDQAKNAQNDYLLATSTSNDPSPIDCIKHLPGAVVLGLGLGDYCIRWQKGLVPIQVPLRA